MSKFHNMDYDKRGPYLVELAKAAGFPVIVVNESANPEYYPDEDGYEPDFSNTFEFDTAKIIIPEDGYLADLNYVGHIIEAALEGRTEMTTSQKYSFGDTPDWWNPFKPVEDGRNAITICAYVNH